MARRRGIQIDSQLGGNEVDGSVGGLVGRSMSECG